MVWALWIAAVLAWLGAAYYLRAALKPDRSAALVHYWLALISVAFALTFLLPPVYRLMYEVSGVPNLGRLLANASAVLAVWSGQSGGYTSLLSARLSTRLRWLATGLTAIGLIAMVALFFVGGPSPDSRDNWESFYNIDSIVAYRFIYQGYLLLSMSGLTVLWTRFALVSIGARLMAGFGLLAAGGVFGLAYLLNDVGTVAATVGSESSSWWGKTGVSDVFISLSVTFLIAGVAIPVWLRVTQALRAHVAFLRLRGLWRELRAARPQMALLPERSLWRDLIDPREAPFRLHRQVVEIRDAFLLLAPNADPVARQLAKETANTLALSERESASLDEAVILWAALHRPGQGPHRRAQADSNNGVSLQFPIHSGTLWTEVSQLVRVKRHLVGTRAMRQVWERLESGTEPAPTLSSPEG